MTKRLLSAQDEIEIGSGAIQRAAECQGIELHELEAKLFAGVALQAVHQRELDLIVSQISEWE